VPEVVTLYVVPEAAVDVPLLEVCQYQISPPDGVPVLVRVTPGDAHCGESLVGFAGAVGNEYTVNEPALVAVLARQFEHQKLQHQRNWYR